MPLASGGAFAARMQLTWEHELLDGDATQHASFVNYRSAKFHAKNQVTPATRWG
jgi:subtilase-type serine protease